MKKVPLHKFKKIKIPLLNWNYAFYTNVLVLAGFLNSLSASSNYSDFQHDF